MTGKTAMTREEIASTLDGWLEAWNRHDLDGVLALFSDDAVFETWAGIRIEGRENIRKITYTKTSIEVEGRRITLTSGERR